MKPKTIEQYQQDIEEIERQKSIIEGKLKYEANRAEQAEKVIKLLIAAGLVDSEKVDHAYMLLIP